MSISFDEQSPSGSERRHAKRSIWSSGPAQALTGAVRALGHVEGKVGIGVEHDVAGARGQAGLDRTAELCGWSRGWTTRTGILGGERVGDGTGVVRGGIVDDDEFVVADLAVGHEHTS